MSAPHDPHDGPARLTRESGIATANNPAMPPPRADRHQHCSSSPPGGIIHTYLGYDPKTFPSPTAPPPDIAGAAMEHMLAYGSLRNLTDEELANAVRIDPSQIAGLGPSLDALLALLMERKEKILSTYETDR